MLRSFLEFLDRQKPWLPLLLRLVVGATFIVHGTGKVFERGIAATAAGYAERGIPLGGILGYIVPIAEFYGGIFVILGLGTRLWAFLQAWIMIFAIAFSHGSQGFMMHGEMRERGGKSMPVSAGWEWQALLLAACLVLAIGGAGTVSLDALLRRWLDRPREPRDLR